MVHILRSNAVWTDERKMLEFQLFFWYGRILTELAKRYQVPVTHLKYLFVEELADIENDYLNLTNIAAKRMDGEFMTISKYGNIRIAESSELLKIKEVIEQQSKNSDIQGNIASRGQKAKYIAKVKVLRSSKECSKVGVGEILVASMTTPDYVSAMDRAIGFITDEGGVTCHAAIVAREMNKPCIIGTKNATQILNDNDKVEMDMQSGAVRVIKRATGKSANKLVSG